MLTIRGAQVHLWLHDFEHKTHTKWLSNIERGTKPTVIFWEHLFVPAFQEVWGVALQTHCWRWTDKNCDIEMPSLFKWHG